MAANRVANLNNEAGEKGDVLIMEILMMWV